MNKDLFYYSTNAEIVYQICSQYFDNKQPIWISDQFEPKNNAPSANPAEIQHALHTVATRSDRYSNHIKVIKTILLNVSVEKFSKGELTQQELDEITEILNRDNPSNYRPLIYIIPQNVINKSRIKKINLYMVTNTGGEEWKIDDFHLEKDIFDIVKTLFTS